MNAHFRPWRVHLGLLLWIGMLCGLGGLTHQSQADLEQLASDTGASIDRRVAAMHRLSARSSATRNQVQLLASTALQSAEPKLRALAAGTDLLRFGAATRRNPRPKPPEAAEAYLAQLAGKPSPSADEWLWFVLYRRKVGGMQVGARRRLDLREAAWTLAALGGQAPPNNQVWQHVQERTNAAWRGPR